jgi:hypothetical protein
MRLLALSRRLGLGNARGSQLAVLRTRKLLCAVVESLFRAKSKS